MGALKWAISVAAASCLCTLGPTAAAAQDGAGADDTATASPDWQALVAEARVAVEHGRLADARRLLEQAFELEPSPAVGFNLGLVLRDLGALLEARAMFERLLSGELGPLPPDRSARAAELLHEVQEALGTVMVWITGPEEAEVRLDGALSGTAIAGQPLRLATDPGEHVILATAPGFRPADAHVALGRAEIRRVDLSLASAIAPREARGTAATDTRRPAPSAGRGGSSVLGSPWLWAGVALAVAAGVVAVILLSSSDARGQSAPPVPEGFLGTVTTP